MKHFFPFLIIPFILCILLHTFSIVPVSAQQHNSFASARYLSLDRSISIVLPANDSAYYYFLSLHPTDSVKQRYQLTISEADSLSVSVYDDQGSAISLKKTSIGTFHWYSGNIPEHTRFFLELHNQTKQDITLILSVKSLDTHTATVTPKSGNNVTVKSGQKTSQATPSKSETAQKSRNSSKQKSNSKSKATRKPRNSSKYASNSRSTSSPEPWDSSKYSSNSKSTSNQKPWDSSRHATDSKSTSKQKIQDIARPTSSSDNQNTNPQTSDHYSNNQKNQTISRSKPILSKHFFRMSAGYSISVFELLAIDSTESGLKIETLTPETISLQNNIIYAKTTGLAVIQIHYNNYNTSCTIYIQDSQ